MRCRALFSGLAALLLLADCSSPPGGPDAAGPDDLARQEARRLDRSIDRAAEPQPDLVFRWPDLPGDRPLKDIESLQGDDLRTALHDLVKGHQALSYAKAKAAIFIPASGGIDVHGGQVECIYTGATVAADGSTSPGSFSVEHSWPQSEGADTLPAQSDLHHLFPVDAPANSHRSNLPFGEVSCGGEGPPCKWEAGGSAVGPSLASGATVFRVRPTRSGDIARAHFYFAVRYQMSVPAEEEAALRGWNIGDPPDALEQDRNTAIEAIQGSRNPFVDRPDFVEHIPDF